MYPGPGTDDQGANTIAAAGVAPAKADFWSPPKVVRTTIHGRRLWISRISAARKRKEDDESGDS
jgi:hypothetical protein